jgi:hypothetical protein
MRRGAWYPAFKDSQRRDVLVDFGFQTLQVHQEQVELRQTTPSEFSVVRRSLDDPNPARGTRGDLGPVYAVCPWSRTRVRLREDWDRLICPDCGHEGPIDWDDRC